MKEKLNNNGSNTIQVFVIEDDKVYRESIQELINETDKLSCKHTFESCEEALEYLEGGDVPQIILLDIQLPGISGIEGIKRLLTISPSTKIVILTVFDDDDKVFNAFCHGASGYLLKSTSVKNIQEAAEQVMYGGAAMSPTIAAKVLKMFNQYAQPKQEYGLTGREKEILQLLVNGMSKKHIAKNLFISLYTVDTHLKNIYTKLHVHSQIDVVAKALKEHLI